MSVFVFFFNDTATTEIYTLSLHDALPICPWGHAAGVVHALRDQGRRRARAWTPHPPRRAQTAGGPGGRHGAWPGAGGRSEEHTSELQSRQYLVCRLLLEKKKKLIYRTPV